MLAFFFARANDGPEMLQSCLCGFSCSTISDMLGEKKRGKNTRKMCFQIICSFVCFAEFLFVDITSCAMLCLDYILATVSYH